MPIVRPYPIGEVSPQPIPNVAPDVPAAGDINLFGGNQARDLQQAGQNLGQASDSLFALYQRSAQEANESRVQDLNNRFLDGSRAILKTGPDAYYNLSGADAVKSADATTAKLTSLKDEVFGQAANRYQRERLAPILDAHLAASTAGIVRHVAGQQAVYARSVAANAIETSQAEAKADPSMLPNAVMRAEGAARVMHAGQPPEAVETGVRAAGGSVIAGAIGDRLARNDPMGVALFKQYADRLDPSTRRTLGAAAETLSNALDATAWVRDHSATLRTPTSTGDAALDAVNVSTASVTEPPPVVSSSGMLLDRDDGIVGTHQRLDEIEARRRALTAQNEQEFAANPARLRANQFAIDADTARNRAVVKADTDNLYADLRRHLTTGGPNGGPAITPPPPPIMSRLTDAQQDAVAAQVNGSIEGRKPSTDPQTWYAIRQGLTGDDATERRRWASTNLVQFMGRLSDEDSAALQKLQASVRTNDGGADQSRLQIVTRVANQALRSAGIDPSPRPNAAPNSDAAQAAGFHRALQSELSVVESKGQMPTETETYGIVNDLKDTAIKGGWLTVNDRPVSLTVLPGIPATDEPFHKDNVVLAQAGSENSKPAGSVPGGREQQSATGEQYGPSIDGLPKIESATDGVATWIFGSGEPRTYPFDQIDTRMVKPEQFQAIREKLTKGIPGTYAIDATKPFWAGKSFMDLGNWKEGDFTSRFLVGNITLRLRGNLVVGADGNYFFQGKLSGDPDHYRMYGSDHRNEADENLTMLGKLLGSVRHRDCWIHFLGEKPIATSNNLAP